MDVLIQMLNEISSRFWSLGVKGEVVIYNTDIFEKVCYLIVSQRSIEEIEELHRNMEGKKPKEVHFSGALKLIIRPSPR